MLELNYVYNELNLQCRNVNNINRFKRELKNYVVDKCLYFLDEYFYKMR